MTTAGTAWRSFVGVLAGMLAWVWLRTLRLTIVADPALDQATEQPWVLAFFHGTQWPLLAWPRRRPTSVLVSLSLDGTLQSRALGLLGFRIVRGSSSRGGARGLAAMVRLLRRGHDAAFAVDGPRGPYGVVKPGVLLAARASHGMVVPMGSAIGHGTVLARAWDRFAIAYPFSRVVVVLGPPLHEASGAADLARAIRSANAHAEVILAPRSGGVVPFTPSA